jgi:hypothetical protein
MNRTADRDSPGRTIIVALTGASGMAYGLRLLECLLAAGERVCLLYSQAAHIVANDFGQSKAGRLDQVHQRFGHGIAQHPCAADQGHGEQREALHGFGQVRLAQRHGPDLKAVAHVVRCTGQTQRAGLRLDADLLQHFHNQAFERHQGLALAQRAVQRRIAVAQAQRCAIAGGAKRAPVVLPMHRVKVGGKFGQALVVAVQAALAVVQIGFSAQGAGAGCAQIV